MKRQTIPYDGRRAVNERDDATCQMCGKVGIRDKRAGRPSVIEHSPNGRNGEICFHFHHKVPLFLDGANDENNIELRCQKCNASEPLVNQMKEYIRQLKGDNGGL